jgi:site-specific DNA recombinase
MKKKKQKTNIVYKEALIYCRVSTVNQENDGSGLQSQEHRCREYARSKGYEVEKVFLDSSSGGGDFMDREGMRELLSYIDKNVQKNYVVIFDDLKRFARDTEFHFKLKATFLARDVKLECLNYRFDDSPEGTFVETIFAAQGQLEKDQNKRQVIQKMKARLDDGYWPFFPPPGYKSEKVAGQGKVLTPHNPKARIITEALEGFASYRFQNIVDLTNFLIKKGFSLNNGKNHVQRTIELLIRPIYAGYIEYPDWGVSRRIGKHKPLISKECFAKIEARLNSNIKNTARKDISKDFPLRNFVACSECKKLMTSSWCTGRSQKYPYYRCTNKACLNKEKNIRADIMEKELLSVLQGVIPKVQLLEYVKAKLNLKWQKTLKEVGEIKKSIQFEIESYKNSIKTYVAQMEKAKSESVLDAIQEQIEDLDKKEKISVGKLYDISNTNLDFGTALSLVFEILKNPYTEWQKGDLDHRRLLLGMIFQGNIPYDRKKGFGTAILQLPSKVFCSFDSSNSCGVEMVGIEPTCKRLSFLVLQSLVILFHTSRHDLNL